MKKSFYLSFVVLTIVLTGCASPETLHNRRMNALDHEHAERVKQIKNARKELDAAKDAKIRIVPMKTSSSPSSRATPLPQGRYEYDQNGRPSLRAQGFGMNPVRSREDTQRVSASNGMNERYPDQSFKGQWYLLKSGLLGFIFPHGKYGQERGIQIPTPNLATTGHPIPSSWAPNSIKKGVAHAREVDPHFDIKRSQGVGREVDTVTTVNGYIWMQSGDR